MVFCMCLANMCLALNVKSNILSSSFVECGVLFTVSFSCFKYFAQYGVNTLCFREYRIGCFAWFR